MPNSPYDKTLPQLDRYKSWGNTAETALKQGWIPQSWDGDTTTFVNSYDKGLNGVYIPGEKKLGHVAVVGSNNSNAFKILIRTADGQIKKILGENLTPEQVQQYFTGAKSTVAQRQQSIAAGTNPDRAIIAAR